MRKELRKRLRDRRGFTLGELLVTILILLMVSGVVAAGIPVAKEAYVKVVDSANAQLLLSTTMTALRTQLGSAQRVKTQETTVETENGEETVQETVQALVWYYSGETAYTSLGNTNEGIKLFPYMKEKSGGGYEPNDNEEHHYSHLLVSGKTATTNLHTTYQYISYNEAAKLFTVKGLKVWQGTSVLAEVPEFTVRAVNVLDG